MNVNAFQQPALGTMSNMRTRNIQGPGFWQLDLALSRTFRFRETRRVELRTEAFNVTNNFNRDNPNTNLNNRLFGQISSSSDARVMQFALKYVF